MSRSLLFLFCCMLFSSTAAIASEQAELAQAIKQLQSAKQALQRAKALAGTKPQQRIYFYYDQANQDINLVEQGIFNYLNHSRAQPRKPSELQELSGDYLKQSQSVR
ncbi:integrative conjugative element protein, RAQPRD family [Gallibacterium anatis]|uniref:Conjugal transfer protein n=3 Tax=Gallibacterium anatis TaxID=750 RepID=A0A921H953_9PAST|nr:RAQPRD family integrative conjugative element protein [Gallibacterium anatis]ERF77319.1 integrative conjugative element protein [Gallibacterium anatis 12656/12]KGQ46967.1 conjugal transfer protein [Gallibacterium anatis]KGQ61808.1 conjugal transfer protein [Gallibacterium anatis 4895]MBF4102126.1 conjugal transfer protein [Gallibacterium anatis]HJF73544.1 conjugal transfer protein [Gallibacterium anatis]